MSALPSFSSLPGMAVPGNILPGLAGTPVPPAVTYQYLGEQACIYLDYLDLSTGHVLSPVPGNSYSMAVASGRNASLTVPPPGRPWNPGNAGAGGTFAPLFRRWAILPPAVSHGHYPGAACGHCDPDVRDRPPEPRRMNGPDVSPADYAADLARGRAHTAALHAAWAQGAPRPEPGEG